MLARAPPRPVEAAERERPQCFVPGAEARAPQSPPRFRNSACWRVRHSSFCAATYVSAVETISSPIFRTIIPSVPSSCGFRGKIFARFRQGFWSANHGRGTSGIRKTVHPWRLARSGRESPRHHTQPSAEVGARPVDAGAGRGKQSSAGQAEHQVTRRELWRELYPFALAAAGDLPRRYSSRL